MTNTDYRKVRSYMAKHRGLQGIYLSRGAQAVDTVLTENRRLERENETLKVFISRTLFDRVAA